MSRIRRMVNHQVVIDADSKTDADAILAAIRRHVDGGERATVTWDVEVVCSWCELEPDADETPETLPACCSLAQWEFLDAHPDYVGSDPEEVAAIRWERDAYRSGAIPPCATKACKRLPFFRDDDGEARCLQHGRGEGWKAGRNPEWDGFAQTKAARS